MGGHQPMTLVDSTFRSGLDILCIFFCVHLSTCPSRRQMSSANEQSAQQVNRQSGKSVLIDGGEVEGPVNTSQSSCAQTWHVKQSTDQIGGRRKRFFVRKKAVAGCHDFLNCPPLDRSLSPKTGLQTRRPNTRRFRKENMPANCFAYRLVSLLALFGIQQTSTGRMDLKKDGRAAAPLLPRFMLPSRVLHAD